MTEGKQKAEAKIGSHRTLRFSQRACFSEKLGLIPLEHRFKKKKNIYSNQQDSYFLICVLSILCLFLRILTFQNKPSDL